jgi:glycosyltransferase involved in cell wall biosynthesis
MKFSLITCTYNSAEFLEENIKSVRAQSYSDFEHVFIDGESRDGTKEILEKYRSEFPERVKIFFLPPTGISAAMNKGIMEASGEYLIHLHADDAFYDQDVLGDVAVYLQKNNYPDWIFGREWHFRDQANLGIYPKFRVYTADSRSFYGSYFLGIINYIRHQTVFIKKSVFTTQGLFREDLRCAMDVEMWSRIKDKTRWLFFDRIIARYRHHEGAQSSAAKNKRANKREVYAIRREYLSPFNFLIFVILDFILDLRNKLKNI